MQATPATQQLGAWTISARATYQDAINAYGKPSACLPRKPRQAFATAVWRTEGFRLKITSLGYIPPGKTFCTDPRHVYVDTAIATGRRWHTTRGLRIGLSGRDALGLALGRSAAQRPGGELRVSGRRRGRLTETCPGTVPGHVSWDDFLGLRPLHLRSPARDAASLAADRTLDFGVPLT